MKPLHNIYSCFIYVFSKVWMSTRILKPVILRAVFCNTQCLQKKENSVLSGLAYRYLWLQSKCNRNIYLYEHLVCFRICPFSTDNTNGAGKTFIKCSSCVWNSFCVSNIRTLWWTGIPHEMVHLGTVLIALYFWLFCFYYNAVSSLRHNAWTHMIV